MIIVTLLRKWWTCPIPLAAIGKAGRDWEKKLTVVNNAVA
jgi:hypothetical protein